MTAAYSINQVKRAGEDLLLIEKMNDEDRFNEIFDILSYWRSSHEGALTQAFDRLKKVALSHDKNPILAKRLKRYKSIINKLFRFKNMKLNRIQDIGGCRVVLNNPKKVIRVIRELKKWPEFKNSDGSLNIDDYIMTPKDDGYRSIHLKGKFHNEHGELKKIEIQVRTTLQHDWATALEIVDIFTKQNLKSNQGDKNWKNFFINISKQFAIMENIPFFNCSDINSQKEYYSSIENDINLLDLHKDTKNLIKKLNIIEKFNAYAQSVDIVNGKIEEMKIKGYVMIEIDLDSNKILSTFFPENENRNAEKIYTDKEKLIAESKDSKIIALVYSGTLSDIKEAYPNYFADSTEFLKYVNVINSSPF